MLQGLTVNEIVLLMAAFVGAEMIACGFLGLWYLWRHRDKHEDGDE